jgi:hypothetical protein
VPSALETPTEAAGPDLSMLDSVVMDRDHTYRPNNPAQPTSAPDGEADAS